MSNIYEETNEYIDLILKRLAEDPNISLAEFSLRYSIIEKARGELLESLIELGRILKTIK